MATTQMSSDLEAKKARLAELKAEVAQLEAEISGAESDRFRGGTYYTAYYATAGFFLGMIGAATSLLVNIIGAPLAGHPPLKLIQVYLTFPLGEKALELESGLALTIGCCLYIATGMLFGMIIHLILTRLGHGRLDYPLRQRLIITTGLGIALWLVNYYGILSWLQPLLFGGNWIVEQIPWWVAMGTHVVFAWTMAFVYPLGVYRPYRQTQEAS